jgi:2'-5' RNA ligase
MGARLHRFFRSKSTASRITSAMANESAVIIPIPEVEPIVGPLRLQYDPAAQLGVPAHITLLYPFCPPHTLAGHVNALRHVCDSIEAFSFSFTGVRRFPATAYLHPDRSETFAQITRTLMERWPDCRPYSGAFADITPHLTVADKVDGETLDAVEAALRSRLPIKCIAQEVWLLTCDAGGMCNWRGCLSTIVRI